MIIFHRFNTILPLWLGIMELQSNTSKGHFVLQTRSRPVGFLFRQCLIHGENLHFSFNERNCYLLCFPLTMVRLFCFVCQHMLRAGMLFQQSVLRMLPEQNVNRSVPHHSVLTLVFHHSSALLCYLCEDNSNITLKSKGFRGLIQLQSSEDRV